MNGVDRFTLAIDTLRRVDTAASEAVPGMSGEFAVRTISDSIDAIEHFTRKREELRAYVYEEGNDPPEILDGRGSGRWRRPEPQPAEGRRQR